ncbi:chaperone NapD [Vibrio mangrovi]|uniref:Chaperone NapD n=1 Tax=Vibrio mangrovi TaxID=474394 RepID=A0A1Y6IX28_9VIBR|nr:chaperone NapD [Vibrio mangrovi]MDW6005364.1 chaperone NapD [Vibrio mangrovi]SMS02196.1 assembly protein for periplasmic nitrate reductase [Vibrio mangrovi]
MQCNEVHISSLVVHAVPDALPTIKPQITVLPGAEIYGESEEGKLVVVLESTHQGFITDTIDVIHQMHGVLGVALVYHQIDSEDADETDTGVSIHETEGDV